MRYILTFLAGAFAGAVAALLYAPTSGEELRAQIRTQAEAEYQRAQAEMQRMQQQMSTKLDETLAAVRELIEELRQEEEPGEVVLVEAEVEAAAAETN